MPVDMAKGRHYTGPPIPAPPRAVQPAPPPPPPEAAPAETAMDRAFARFRKPIGDLEPAIENLLQEAFVAGYSAALHPPIEELAGTKTSRTIVAALRMFKDFVLTQQPEEASTGEWCSLKEIDQLILEWEGKDS